MKQKGKLWIDAKGVEIPVYAISQVMQMEEIKSQKIIALALKSEKALTELVQEVRNAYNELYEAKVLEAKMKGNKGGQDALTIDSFDGTVSIKVTKPKYVNFDTTTMSLIKEKIDEFLNGLETKNGFALLLKDLLGDLMKKKGGQFDQTKLTQIRKNVSSIKDKPEFAKKIQPLLEAVELFDRASRIKKGNTGIYIDLADEEGKMRRVALKYTDI